MNELPGRLTVRRVARHAKQFAAQMSRLLRSEFAFETRLRSRPVNGRVIELLRAMCGQYDLKPTLALPVGGRSHQAAPQQRLERPHQRCSVHHHRFREVGHGQAIADNKRAQDGELRGRDVDGRQVVLVKLRDMSRSLAKRETVVVKKVDRVHAHSVVAGPLQHDGGRVIRLLPFYAGMAGGRRLTAL